MKLFLALSLSAGMLTLLVVTGRALYLSLTDPRRKLPKMIAYFNGTDTTHFL